MNHSAHVPIEHIAVTKTGLILGSQAIAGSEPGGRVVVVLVVPIARDLPVMIIESRMILVVVILTMSVLIAMILILFVILCPNRPARESEDKK